MIRQCFFLFVLTFAIDKIRERQVSGEEATVKSKGKAQSCSLRAGQQIPVGRTHWMLGKGNTYRWSIYLAADIEHLVGKMLDLIGTTASDNNKTIILPRHLQQAIFNDEGSVTIAQGSVLLNIQSILMTKKNEGAAAFNDLFNVWCIRNAF